MHFESALHLNLEICDQLSDLSQPGCCTRSWQPDG